MATYKLVDTEQLDTDLKAIADKIREKGGTADDLAFPQGFTDAVEAIEAGGGEFEESLKGVIERTATNITLPEDLTSIGRYVFYHCTNLELTSLPEGLTSIGDYAFRDCANIALTSLPEGITSIGMYAFRGCTNLALTSLPEGLTNIANGAFYGCTNLALTSLPEGIKTIDSYAFRDCTGLTTMTFKSTPTTLNPLIFQGCTNLLTINVPWAEGAVKNAPWGATNATINYNYVEG